MRYKNELAIQHGSHPLLKGNLTLVVKFYFPPQQSIKNREDTHCSKKPDYVRLFQFVNEIALGVLYDNHSAIIKFEGEKLYSLKPRTEIILIEERKK